MKDNGCLIAILSILCLLSSITNFMGRKLIDKLEERNKALKHKYEVVCSSLNDCCRNMMDAYELPDSIYNHYLDVIEEEGFNKLEVKYSYFSY